MRVSRGHFHTGIAALVGCDRHTVSRVVGEAVEPLRWRRGRPMALEVEILVCNAPLFLAGSRIRCATS